MQVKGETPMRRLFTWVFLVVMLSQFPQISDQFREEQEGVQAACRKAEKTIKAAETAYDKTQKDVAKVQESLTKMKKDVDKTSSKVSKYCEGLESLTNGLGERKGESLEKRDSKDIGSDREAGK
jgi:peptidoglycan hydrolase CwlO-like protein